MIIISVGVNFVIVVMLIIMLVFMDSSKKYHLQP